MSSFSLNKLQMCPNCGRLFENATPIHAQTAPSPGDICICWKCGSVFEWAEDLTVKKLGKKEFDALPPHTQQLIEGAVRFCKDRQEKEGPPEGGEPKGSA